MIETGEKQTQNVYDAPGSENSCIVIDNGTFEFKAGYLGKLAMIIKNKIYKHKDKVSFEPFASSSVKTMFDSDVIVHFDVLEYTIDDILEYLKPKDLKDLIFTITPSSPTESDLLEFLFEVYKFERVQLGYDFAYCYHKYFDGKDCVVLDLKFSSIIVAVIKDHTIRDVYKINFGGKDLQEYVNYIMVDKYKEVRKDFRGLVSYIRASDDYDKESVEIYTDICNGIYDRNIFLSEKKEQQVEREIKKIKRPVQANSLVLPTMDLDLLNAADESLDKDQLKEKKRVKMVFFGTMARLKARVDKLFRAFDEIIENTDNEMEKISNLGKYVAKKKAKFNDLKRELDLRDQLRRNSKNKKTREFQIKFKEGQLTEEEQALKNMISDAEDDAEGDRLISQINGLASEILLLDPDFIPFYANTVEILRGDNIGRQCINIELVKWAEIMFEPSIIGSDQMGLKEIFESIFSEFQIGNVLICGGYSFIENIENRVRNEILQYMFDGEINVVKAADSQQDPFYGAKMSELFPVYERKDFDKLGAHKLIESFKKK